MSAWTTERREKMSALMHELKPWVKSTGPVTPEGKKWSSLNGNTSKLKSRARPQTEPPKLAVDNASSGQDQPSETREQRELREYRAFRASLE